MANVTRTKTPSESTERAKIEEHAKCRSEVKKLRADLTEAQTTLNRISKKNGELRQRVSASRIQKLALRQYNRMLMSMVTGYMDREAVLLANTRTLMQAYPLKEETDRIQETIHEVFE